MEKERLKKFITQLNSLKIATKKPVCKICFEEFTPKAFQNFSSTPPICYKCKQLMKTKIHFYKLDNVSVNTLYIYEKPFSDWIFQFKESLDIELHDVFFDGFNAFIDLFYIGYYVVFMPSSIENLKRRGFNHLQEMFKKTTLPVIENLLIKLDNIDQKSLNKKQREAHLNFIGAEKLERIKDKKILLVEDVISTGNSIKQALKVLKGGKPRKIKVLVLAENY